MSGRFIWITEDEKDARLDELQTIVWERWNAASPEALAEIANTLGNRWAAFTDDELSALESWHGMAESDFGPLNDPLYSAMATEIGNELRRRAQLHQS